MGHDHRALTSSVLFVVFNPLVDPRRRVILFMSGLWGWGVLLYVRLFLRVTIEGREKINGACIICPNDDLIADIITFLGVLPNFAFVAQNYVFDLLQLKRDFPTTYGRRPRGRREGAGALPQVAGTRGTPADVPRRHALAGR